MFRHGDGKHFGDGSQARHTCRDGGRPPALSPRDGPRLAQGGQTFRGLKSKNSFSTEKNSKYAKSTNHIFYDRRRAKFKIPKAWEDIKSPLD
jgi:hypothetical protein